ncbi:MAG: hypothetical protein Kow00109_26940 [Acidobacteriota bacterium]
MRRIGGSRHRASSSWLQRAIFSTIFIVHWLGVSLLAQSVTLEWDPNSEPDLAGYNIYRSLQSGSGYVKLNSSLIQSTTYTDTTIEYGTTYYYVATAVNTAGLESGYSNEVSYTAVLPPQPPVAVGDAASVNEDGAVTIPVLANDSDPNGDPLQIVAVGSPGAGSVNYTATQVIYTPPPNWSGVVSFSYTISDGAGGQATATVTVTVVPVNDPPVANDDTVTVAEDGVVEIDVLANDTDVEGDTLALLSFGSAAHGSLERVGENRIRYTPVANYHGSDTFLYNISDGKGGTDAGRVYITVTPVNDPPVANADTATAVAGQAVSISVLANDSDVDGDSLSIAGVSQPAHGTAEVVGSAIRYTAAAGYQGSDSFTYTVSDGNGGTATAQVTVQVTAPNQSPQAAPDGGTVAEDGTLVLNVVANDSDPDGDTLTVTGVTQPAHGTAEVASSTSVRYRPAANYHGGDSFTYTVGDGRGGTATATVTITVTPVNDFPVAVGDAVTVPEDGSVDVDVLANDSDVDGDSLTITSVGNPTHGSATLLANQRIRYVPAANYHGSDSFTYTIADGNGGTVAATVSVTVTSVNDVPVAADDTLTVAEDTSGTVYPLANDSDPDGEALTIASVGPAQHGTVTAVAGSGLRYTPNPNFFGTDAFTYSVKDAAGATAGATVRITVTSVNDLPLAQDDAVTTSEEQPVTVAVLANDSDPDGDTLTLLSLGSPLHGTAVRNSDQTVTYTPDPNFAGEDSFSYTVSDGNGGSSNALVVVIVIGDSEAPVANDDVATTPEDQPVIVSVLANDSDPDGDELAVTAVSAPAHGTATLEGSKAVRYVPAPNFNGTDTFTYTVSDGSFTDVGTVIVTVTPVNDAPIAVADAATVTAGQAVLIQVLANDEDVDGDTLEISSLTQPVHGTAVVQGVAVQYTPAAGYTGTDQFSYTVTDGKGGTASALVQVTVTGGDQPPVAGDDAVTTPEDTPVELDALANDTDPEGAALVITSVSPPAHGTATILAARRIRYTPNPDFHGADSFTYTAEDSAGNAATGQVSVVVTPVNDPPITNEDRVEVVAGEVVTVDVLANDSDVDGDSLTLVAVGAPAHGTAEVVDTSRVRYRPEAGYAGEDEFAYTVSDGHVSREGVVRVTVLAQAAAEPKTLVFPATVDTGTSPQFRDTFVGLGLVNAGDAAETLVVESRTRGGNRLARADWVGLQPRAQVATLTSELPVYQPGAVALAVEAPKGGVQGFFMVGDYAQKRLDGVGAILAAANDLVFPLVREDGPNATLVQMMNPSDSDIAWLALRLYDAEGRLLRKVNAAIAPGGSFMGTVGEIFGANQKVVDGYVKVQADSPVMGYEAVASQGALAAAAAQQAAEVTRLVSPHVFADGRGGDSQVYLLSTSDRPVGARLRIRDDEGYLLAEADVTLEPNRLAAVSTEALLRGAGWSGMAGVSGSLEVELAEAAPIVAGVLHESAGRKAAAYVPLEAAGLRETIFPHVAVAPGTIFTGLAVANPNDAPASVTVQVYDETGQLVAERPFVLAPGARRVGLLSDPAFFGPEFQRLSGHIRVLSDVPTVTNALFGDFRGEYLSTIQGQGVE